MIKAFKTAQIAERLLRRSRFGFCVGVSLLNPQRHITMNHNSHNMYLDLFEYGQYEDLVLIGSEAPRTYEPQVLSLLTRALSTRYVPLPPLRAPPSPPTSSSPTVSAAGPASSHRTCACRRARRRGASIRSWRAMTRQ